ncbi:MAG: hypothetical protein QOF00_2282 [Pseudonocardiales bacterium]|jgi:hypothetical protein|nr:hypothetical protein [Pseudonocardiales bacterium]
MVTVSPDAMRRDGAAPIGHFVCSGRLPELIGT